MESLLPILLNYGYVGMFVAAFLAGSFFPFSSEAVLTALLFAGLQLIPLALVATAGNTLGGLFNYAVGHLGREDWIYGLLRTRPDRLARSRQWVERYGAWMGLLSWLPVAGSVITIAMGLLRLNVWKSTCAIFLGKALRYLVLALILQQI